MDTFTVNTSSIKINHSLLKISFIPLVVTIIILIGNTSFAYQTNPQAKKHCHGLHAAKYCSEKKWVEDLDRGLVVIPSESGNVISWRLLEKDSSKQGFTIFRNGKKINKKPIKDSTFYIDATGKATDRYQIATRGEHRYLKSNNEDAQPWANPYLNIPLNKPENDSIFGNGYSYSANDTSVADLDGDGRYEVLVKWNPGNAKDNAQSGHTGNVFIDAYTLEGQQLWRIDLGRNIRAGAHYTQFIAYDFDGDGRAEIAMKTADGTIDGRGTVIGDATADYRNAAGYILEGPEYLTMFDGLSGEALDTIDYVPQRGNVSSWGDNYGNRVDRFLAGVAYLDGQKPSLFMARGYYTRAVVAAFDWVEGSFQQRWVFDTNNGGGDEIVYGQGAHSVTVGDVDGDGRDEIVYGAAVIDDNGHALYSTGLGHGDAMHLTDINPERPGMEIFMVHECASCYTKDGIEYGVELHDAATGEILWNRPSNGADVGRGVSIDIDPRFVGNENWGSRGGLVAANGTLISENRPPQMSFASWWDGDLLREILDGTSLYKWDYDNQVSVPLLEASLFNAVSNNGTKANPALSADILGDWREELVLANADSSALMIFSSSIPTQYRIPTLMQNPQYRTAIAWQNVGYNQPPHPDFYLGSDTKQIPDYNVKTISGSEWAKLVAHGYQDHVVVRLYSHKITIKSADIFRSTSSNPSSSLLIGRVSGSNPQLIDTRVVPDVDYYYWAKIKGAKGKTRIDPGVSKTRLSISLIPQLDFAIINNKVPVQLTWRTRNMDIRRISVYRAETPDENSPADFASSQLVGSPAVDLLSWSDASATAGKNYYYWLEFDDAISNEIIRTQATYVATVLEPKTNLSSSLSDAGISLSWELQDFPPIGVVEIFRNTRNQASGRTRILTSAPEQGTLLDSTDLVVGTTYWYMFKLTMEDGTTVNTIPEAMITF